MKTLALFLTAVALAVIVPTGNPSGRLKQQGALVFVQHTDAVSQALRMDGLDDFLGRTTRASLGNAADDKKMRDEVGRQRRFFQGVQAKVLILDERSYELRNAFATKGGKIYFGKNMFYYTIKHYNELAVAGILAHEWGHRVQYTYGFEKDMTTQEAELEADAISGFYMALEKGFAWSQIHGYFASTLNTGDYDVTSPQHHGTPNQRVAAAYLGVQLAIEAVENGEGFSYKELHTRILDSLQTSVIEKNKVIERREGSKINQIALGKTSGLEIVAPVLSAEEKKKYYPHAD